MRATAAVVRLIELEKFTLFWTQILTPSTPIMPYSRVAAPPRTPAGTVAMSSPNFGEKLSTTAKVPATQYAAVEYTLVAAMTPMFSAYVVVPEPPPKPASTVAAPSASSARPETPSRFWPVIADTDFTWPMFSATRTRTTGTKRPTTPRWNSGVWKWGRPTQAAASILE